MVCACGAHRSNRHPSAGGDYPAKLYREEVGRDGGTGGARRAGKYSVSEHVKGLHVVFMPERTTDSGGNKSKQFLQGARVEELPLNTVEKEEPEP